MRVPGGVQLGQTGGSHWEASGATQAEVMAAVVAPRSPLVSPWWRGKQLMAEGRDCKSVFRRLGTQSSVQGSHMGPPGKCLPVQRAARMSNELSAILSSI